jgi:hypothetical protein
MPTRSLRMFVGALEYHRAAIESDRPENQLLDLWASLEGLLPTPPDNSARISYYCDTILPVLTLTYAERMFRYLRWVAVLAGPGMREFLSTKGQGTSFFEQTTSLTVCTDLAAERDELFAKLDNYPLLRFRFYEIGEKFRSSKRVRETLLAHRKKVGWHLQRIYRARNLISHTAQALPYLPALVENLHVYIDLMLSSIPRVYSKYRSQMSLATVFAILKASESSLLQDLANADVPCDKSNYQQIVFGTHNPLTPTLVG